MNDMNSKTPYAYACGLVLQILGQELEKLDAEMAADVNKAKLYRMFADVQALSTTYMFTAHKFVMLWNNLMEAVDMAIPDDEKAILNQEFNALKNKIEILSNESPKQ